MKGSLLESLWGTRGRHLLAADASLFVILAALSLALSLPMGEGKKPARADVEISGGEGFRLSLADDAVREAKGPLGATQVEVRGGKVRVLSSPCPLKLCEKRGWIDRGGEMIVCLPNEVVVRLPGRLSGGVDALSR